VKYDIQYVVGKSIPKPPFTEYKFHTGYLSRASSGYWPYIITNKKNPPKVFGVQIDTTWSNQYYITNPREETRRCHIFIKCVHLSDNTVVLPTENEKNCINLFNEEIPVSSDDSSSSSSSSSDDND
jgi:hypothetical protein